MFKKVSSRLQLPAHSTVIVLLSEVIILWAVLRGYHAGSNYHARSTPERKGLTRRTGVTESEHSC